MSKFLYFLFFILLSFVRTIAQNSDPVIAKYDSTYIKTYAHKLNIYIPFVVKQMKFSIVNNKEKNTLTYYPNQSLRMGLGFSYKAQSLAFTIGIPFLNNDNTQYGKTKHLDLQYNIYGRKLVFDINFQRYKGFYVQNPGKYNSGFDPSGPYPQRPDIQTIAFGSTVYYSFNHKKFSYRAAFTQTEWQKKSAGSFLLGGYLTLFEMAADSNIIGYPYRSHFNKDGYLKSSGSLSTGIAFGYVHTFVIKRHLFITLSLVPGFGFQSYRAMADDSISIKDNSKLAIKTQGRFAMGYNTPNWYGGIALVSDNLTLSNSSNSTLTYGYGNFKFFVGKRFTVKKRKSL